MPSYPEKFFRAAERPLESENVRLALPRYRKILLGKAKPNFKINKSLEQKIKAAAESLKSCQLCERKCKANRLEGQKGWCQVLNRPLISSVFEHYGEEPFFTPSLTVFFWSCTFACQYCQNWSISQRFETPLQHSEPELAKIINKHKDCRNVNFVGGEPTPHLPFILKTLKHVRLNIPVIWNSNFYMSKLAMGLLKGIVDVWLTDWKYWSNSCAERLSKVSNYRKIASDFSIPRTCRAASSGYLEIIKRNHALAFKDSEMVIRHLILPDHFECCTKPILEYVAETFGKKVIVNLMAQYRPEYKASEYEELLRLPTKDEIQKVIACAEKLDLNFVT